MYSLAIGIMYVGMDRFRDCLAIGIMYVGMGRFRDCSACPGVWFRFL